MIKPNYNVKDISEIIALNAVLRDPDQLIAHLLTDSRKIFDPSTTIFFALNAKRDAHQYIAPLYEIGVRCFVISQNQFDISIFPDANFIWVEDSLAALQKLAAFHRQQFKYPIIGITGSNGKTIVKEWLFYLLAPDHNIIRSPKSYNSQIGVPLSVWKMIDNYDLAIFEAGISKPAEMQKLEKIIEPTLGILTNISASHDEGFLNREQKLQEKLKLFKNAQTLIVNSKYLDAISGVENIFSWSFNQSADLQVLDTITTNGHTTIKAIYENKNCCISIPFSDQASIENAVICWATLLQLKFDQTLISQRMEKLSAVKMRLELKMGIHQTAIIDDSYNSDFSSLEIAIDFLNQQNQYPNQTLILSDILQTGIPPAQLYQQVAQLVASKGINKFIGIGEEISKYQDYFKLEKWFFDDTKSFLANFDRQLFKNETILLKGARTFEFEHISKILTQKVHDTVLEINLNALIDNLNYYKSKLQPHVKMMAMVKAFAYGSGSDEIARILQHHKVDYLAVAYADEGVALRQAGISLPIMVMSPELSSFDVMVSNLLEPELYNFRILAAFADYLRTKKISSYPVHIKLDTGMHRLGFMSSEVDMLISFLKTHSCLNVRSILSHLAASESQEHEKYTLRQVEVFNQISTQISDSLGYPIIKHIANTAAISKWPNAQFDMVRLGIGLYGLASLASEKTVLQNVATLKTTITQIKTLKKGDSVGYGRSGVMEKDGEIAIVKIGYADGYPRALGNGCGKMSINGKLAPTIGHICMDMSMLDVTDLEVNEGDDVNVFGEEISVYDLAKQLNTIPYEIISNLSQRIKRVYFYE